MQERFETFTVLINRISRNIRRIKNQEMAEYNLRSVHVSCLYYLYTNKGATATDLCERCEEDKATISRAVDYLETNGFLSCESKSTKRYKSPLMLTDKGNEAGEKIADKINAQPKPMFLRLPNNPTRISNKRCPDKSPKITIPEIITI